MRRGGCGGCLFRVISLLLLLVVIGGIVTAWSLYQPYRGFTQPVFLDFDRGTSTREMAAELSSHGIIRYRWQFLLARVFRPSARLQAGEYQFANGASVWTVFDRIVRGDVFYYEVTAPEGSNMFDIAANVEQLGFIKAADFIKVARDPSLIHDLAPQAPTLEGYLFPSTYRITRRTTAAELCRIMTDLFRKQWRVLVPPGTSPSVNAAVTLASMIEKETAVPAERATVASVYQNRLRIGMALDCDPTTIYAALLEHRYRGVIHRSDLASANDYNTYRHSGMPPGPIANPGIASLQAALQPAQTDYLYFVARGDSSGGHRFSSTIAEHERNVAAYRRTQR